ncbi:SH3 domain-containing protein [uncultured Roseibium sp.]|uniref:SH3 domain-containing protein n=1 Tax=uncultured Roseibium sp. TaxID=1936171 RepID=UPI003216C11A
METIPEEGRAQYTGPDDIASLPAMPNGAYVSDNSGISFQRTEQGGTLWLGDVSFPCEVTTARAPVAPPPTVLGGPEQLNHVGQSLGGRLRSGPGTNYPQIGNIEDGTYLTILSNTGVSFDGYDWFEVALDNGQRGFQWGGILCSNGGQLVGLYASCQNIPR